MSRLIYIDTNVYIDYFENRSYWLRPASEFASILIQRAISCEFRIIISTPLIKELEKRISQEQIDEFFGKLRKLDKIIDVKTTFGAKRIATELSKSGKIHYADALHYALALASGAEAIVTNDKAFLILSDTKLCILQPEQI